MNNHKNARLTFDGRKLLIERIAVMGLVPAARAAGISVRTVRKWRARFNEHGLAGLLDRSSWPTKTRTSLNAQLLQRIEQLCRGRMPMRRIAVVVGRSVATIRFENRMDGSLVDGGPGARAVELQRRCFSVTCCLVEH